VAEVSGQNETEETVTETPEIMKGVFTAVLTPLKKDGTPDDAKLARHCRWLLANGSDGLAVLGTTGEANSFCLKERIRIVESLAEAEIPGHVLMPGTGACAMPDVITLTRVAVKCGAHGVLMLPPFYYKNVSDDGLFAYYAGVIDGVADKRLRIYLYHFPQMSTVPLGYNLIERLLKAYPGVVVGMKDSSGDFENMKGAAKRFPGFAVFPGSDHLLLPMLKEGGAGCITACCNVVSALAAEVYNGFKVGRDVTTANEQLTATRKTIEVYPLVSALKTIMARSTSDDAWLAVRPPLVTLDAAKRQALFKALDGIGFALPKAA
jgi:4-hydroxy-tetrahydrodipicolinate synthase